jgi:hypothetical protein
VMRECTSLHGRYNLFNAMLEQGKSHAGNITLIELLGLFHCR